MPSCPPLPNNATRSRCITSLCIGGLLVQGPTHLEVSKSSGARPGVPPIVGSGNVEMTLDTAGRAPRATLRSTTGLAEAKRGLKTALGEHIPIDNISTVDILDP